MQWIHCDAEKEEEEDKPEDGGGGGGGGIGNPPFTDAVDDDPAIVHETGRQNNEDAVVTGKDCVEAHRRTPPR